ncbi:Cut9-interacting protein scn1 [Tieghemiomyces parasiticus]|uniref:Cut9-interacting protein scn1 n=1 Tax=Tieghemiomyces parasiticus TaxID=78921 RepID=A0A9W8A4V5_9FUNG|nr:Cut9-interacting protein scn1 [Tieghemiomyces parasiticus]
MEPPSSPASASPCDEAGLYQHLVDAHCHIHEDLDFSPACWATLDRLQTRHLAVMGWRESNWDHLERLLESPWNGRQDTLASPSTARPGHIGGQTALTAPTNDTDALAVHGRILPGFGLHPWATEPTVAQGPQGDRILCPPSSDPITPFVLPVELQAVLDAMPWLGRLRRLLERYPQAIVGEIGLDRLAVDLSTQKLYDYPCQTLVFVRQWDLAIEYGRPVSVHCVKAADPLYKWVRERVQTYRRTLKQRKQRRAHPDGPAARENEDLTDPVPVRVMMHSYSGSVDILRQILKLPGGYGRRFYFSFSATINARSPQTNARMAAVPLDRLLIETDVCDPAEVDHNMLTIARRMAQVKELPLDQMVKQLRLNSAEFFRVADPTPT